MRHATDKREIAKVLSCVMAIAVIDFAVQCVIQSDSCPQLLLFMRLMAGNNVEKSHLRNRSSSVVSKPRSRCRCAEVWRDGSATSNHHIITFLSMVLYLLHVGIILARCS